MSAVSCYVDASFDTCAGTAWAGDSRRVLRGSAPWHSGAMSESQTAKADLHRYLMRAREALLWKLDGLTEYQVRRPMVATGTNLLGLVKHVAYTEAEYLGVVFGRPFPESSPVDEPDAEPNVDMWATASESRESIVDLYRRVWAHGDATIEALDLDTEGVVPWWSEDRRVTSLQTVLVHLVAEANRHAGHADILRELIDGSTGLNPAHSNLPDVDPAWWTEYAQHLEAVARQAAGLDD
jgi:uncharacterized damage-inducible protein DinB